MKISTHFYLPLLAVATACGGGGSSSEPSTPAPANSAAPVVVEKTLPSVSDILAMVYDNSYTVPDGFFVDDRASTPRSYTIHHVLDNSVSYELCTDDYSEALAWEEADNASRSVQGRFVGSVENDRYFEVARELSYSASIGNISDITSPGFSRVFKCSNTVREGVDRSVHNGFAGTINARPLTSERVREFTEYLWQFAFFPTARKKVLDSYADSSATTLDHTLLLGIASTGAAGNGCDLVEVIEWTYSSNRNTGQTNKSFNVVDTIAAKLENGAPVLCD